MALSQHAVHLPRSTQKAVRPSDTPYGAKLGKVSVNMPRQIRVRVARSPVGMRKVKLARGAKVVTPPSPRSPHQEATQNAKTGRFALGPWGGPYSANAAAPGDALPATLYMDNNGACHYGLSSDDPGTQQLMRALKAQEEAERQEALQAKAQHEASLERAGAMRARRNESMHRQAMVERPRTAGRPPVRSAARLFQPRRS